MDGCAAPRGRVALKVSIVAVGKIKERGLRDLLADYYKRIGRYARFTEHVLKDGDEATVAERFRRATAERARVFALEVEGRALSSHGLADAVAECELHSVPEMTFLIGGSYGLPKAISRAAHERISLSSMTLPHRLARLVLAEQVYRAFTILRNEPYSH